MKKLIAILLILLPVLIFAQKGTLVTIGVDTYIQEDNEGITFSAGKDIYDFNSAQLKLNSLNLYLTQIGYILYNEDVSTSTDNSLTYIEMKFTSYRYYFKNTTNGKKCYINVTKSITTTSIPDLNTRVEEDWSLILYLI